MADIREKLDNLNCGMDTLAVFRSLLDDKALSILKELLRESADDDHFNIGRYSQFAAELYSHNVNFSEYLLKTVLEDENFYIAGKAAGKEFDDCIEDAVSAELSFLQELSHLTRMRLHTDITGYILSQGGKTPTLTLPPNTGSE